MSVNIHGKEYRTVAERVAAFRANEKYTGWAIHTDIVSIDDSSVVMSCRILDADMRLIATGHAEESRQASKINRTSALENCETSAVGRALTFVDGDLMGTEIASADEVNRAISQQGPTSQPKMTGPVTKKQGELLLRLCNERHSDEMAAVDALADDYGVTPQSTLMDTIRAMSKQQASEVIDQLMGGN